MNKKYLLLMVVLLCFTSFAYAEINTLSIILNYGNESLGTTMIDLAGNSNGTMENGVSLTNWDITFDGNNDYIEYPNIGIFDGTTGFSFDLWVNPNTVGETYKIFSTYGERFIVFDGTLLKVHINGGWEQISYTLPLNVWSHLVITYDENVGFKIYQNNINTQNLNHHGAITSYNNYNSIGQISGANSFDGEMSNFKIFNKTLNQTEITELYNNGRTYNYFPSHTPTTYSYPYEEINVFKQENPISVTSTSNQVVFSTSFLKAEVGTGYITYVGNIEAKSNPVPDIYCHLDLNGIQIETNVTYLNPNLNNKYAFYSESPIVDYISGENTIIMHCRGSNNKLFTTSNVIVTAFELFDTDNYNFTIFNGAFDLSINSPGVYIPTVSNLVPIPQYNYTNSNKSTYVIYTADLTSSYPVSNTANGYLTIDNQTCGVASRYGNAGQTGSGNFICSKKFDNNETFFNITSHNKGIFDLNVRSTTKFLSLYDYEHNFNVLSEINLTTGNGWENISSLGVYVDNVDKSIYTIASITAQGVDVPIEVGYRLAIIGVGNSTIYRDFTGANQEGIIGNHDVFTSLSTGNYTILLQGYSNGSISDVSTVLSGNFMAYVGGAEDLNPDDFTITAYDTILNSFVQSFTVSDGLTLSTTNGIINYPRQNELINLTFISQNYFNTTVYNHNTSNNYEYNVTPYPWINFTFTEYFSDASISDFQIVCDDGYLTGIASGTSLIYQMNGNVTTTSCTFTHANYSTTSFNITGIVTSSLNTYTKDIFTTNSILMSFYDEGNLSLITSLVTAEVIGTYKTGTNTTTSGSLYFDLLSPDSYTIRYSAVGYNTNTYYLTLVDKSTHNLSFYLSKNTTTTAVTATVYDEKTQYVEDARIKVLAEDPSNPSQYITTQMCDTNFEGVCQFDLQLDTKQYKFIIEYPFGVVKKITNPSYIFDTSIDFQILIGEAVAEEYLASKDVWGVVDYTSDAFKFTYNDPNNGISQACMKIYSITPVGKTLYSVDCSVTVGGIINASVAPINGTSYLAQGFVYYGSSEIPINEAYKSYKGADSGFGLNGAFLLLFVVITFAAIAMWNPVILITFLPLPLTLGKFMGFLDVEWLPLLGLHFTFIIIAYLISDRG